MEKSATKKLIILTIVSIVVLITVVLLLVLKKLITPLLALSIVTILIGVPGFVVLLIFVIKKLREGSSKEEDLKKQEFDANKWIVQARNYVKYTYTDYLVDVIAYPPKGLGTPPSPILRIKGFGTDTMRTYNLLYNIDTKKFGIIIGDNVREIDDAMNGLASVPPLRQTKTITRRDSVTGEILEQAEISSPTVTEQHEKVVTANESAKEESK